MKLQAIFICGGHGKSWYGTNDCGAVNGNLTEREINVAVGRSLLNKLKKNFPNILIQGVGVETDASNGTKQKFLNNCIKQNGFNSKNCLSLHLHCNSATNKTAKGVEAYSDYAEMADFGSTLTNHIANWFGTKDRGLKVAKNTRAGFITSDACPSILLEMGFLSNDYDKVYLQNTKKLAETISFVVNKIFNS